MGHPNGLSPWCFMGRPAYQRLKGKSAGLVMPRTEWHGEIVYWGKVQPVHAWKTDLKAMMMMMMMTILYYTIYYTKQNYYNTFEL